MTSTRGRNSIIEHKPAKWPTASRVVQSWKTRGLATGVRELDREGA